MWHVYGGITRRGEGSLISGNFLSNLGLRRF